MGAPVLSEVEQRFHPGASSVGTEGFSPGRRKSAALLERAAGGSGVEDQDARRASSAPLPPQTNPSRTPSHSPAALIIRAPLPERTQERPGCGGMALYRTERRKRRPVGPGGSQGTLCHSRSR